MTEEETKKDPSQTTNTSNDQAQTPTETPKNPETKPGTQQENADQSAEIKPPGDTKNTDAGKAVSAEQVPKVTEEKPTDAASATPEKESTQNSSAQEQISDSDDTTESTDQASITAPVDGIKEELVKEFDNEEFLTIKFSRGCVLVLFFGLLLVGGLAYLCWKYRFINF